MFKKKRNDEGRLDMERRYASAGPNKQMYEMYNMSMRTGTGGNTALSNNDNNGYAYIVENKSNDYQEPTFIEQNTYGATGAFGITPANEYTEEPASQQITNEATHEIAEGSVDNLSVEVKDNLQTDIERANH